MVGLEMTGHDLTKKKQLQENWQKNWQTPISSKTDEGTAYIDYWITQPYKLEIHERETHVY